MSRSSSPVPKIMKKWSSKEVVAQNKEYTRQRKDGEIKSMATKYPKLNSCLMGGIEMDTITCISALSGAGKSTLSKTFRDSFVEKNPDTKFKQYIFNFEMIAHQQIARSIVADAKIGLQELYSTQEPLSDEKFESLDEYYDKLSERDIDFIEVGADPRTIVDSIIYYWKTECKEQGLTMIYEIDHVKLVKGREGQRERDVIDELMSLLVDAKKYIASEGGHSIGIILSQMNREIRSTDRIRNAELHRPDTSCLFGASSIEFACDYILFTHIPAKLGIQSYTVLGLPVKYKLDGEVYMMPYFELVKQRSGESDLTIPMYNDLRFFDFNEMDSETFKGILEDFTNNNGIPEINTQKNIFG